MAPSTAGRGVLIKVAQHYGTDGVAARLGITLTLLERLLAGLAPVPDPLLVKAIDLLPAEAPAVPAASLNAFLETPSSQ